MWRERALATKTAVGESFLVASHPSMSPLSNCAVFSLRLDRPVALKTILPTLRKVPELWIVAAAGNDDNAYNVVLLQVAVHMWKDPVMIGIETRVVATHGWFPLHLRLYSCKTDLEDQQGFRRFEVSIRSAWHLSFRGQVVEAILLIQLRLGENGLSRIIGRGGRDKLVNELGGDDAGRWMSHGGDAVVRDWS